MAIILKGRELGIGPMEGFSSIHVIQGKPTISPQLMMALAGRSGQLEDCIVEDDGHACTVTVKRRGRSPYTAAFLMEDARAIGLVAEEIEETTRDFVLKRLAQELKGHPSDRRHPSVGRRAACPAMGHGRAGGNAGDEHAGRHPAWRGQRVLSSGRPRMRRRSPIS